MSNLRRSSVACWRLLRGRYVVRFCVEVRRESVSYANRTRWCYTRRYSVLPYVYVRLLVCSFEFVWFIDVIIIIIFIIIIIIIIIIIFTRDGCHYV